MARVVVQLRLAQPEPLAASGELVGLGPCGYIQVT